MTTSASKLLTAVLLASVLSAAAPSRAAAGNFGTMVQALMGLFTGHAFGMQVSLLAQSSHGGGKPSQDPGPAPAPSPN